MYFLNPIRLEFNYNPNKHLGKMSTRWNDNRINLKGNIKCLICEDKEAGLKLLAAEIWNTYQLEGYAGVEPEDFALIYESEIIENNRVYASGHVVGSKKLDQLI